MPSALSIPMGMAQVRLALLHRAGARPRRAPPAHAARQGAGRIVVDQRARVRARQCAGLRALGSGRRARAGTTPPCCPTSAAPRRAPKAATPTAAIRARSRPATARLRTLCTRPGSRPASRPAIRRPKDVNGYQQEGFGRLDMTVGGRAPLQRRECLSAAGDEAPEPLRAHACTRDAHSVRRQARHRHRVSPGRRAPHGRARGAR